MRFLIELNLQRFNETWAGVREREIETQRKGETDRQSV